MDKPNKRERVPLDGNNGVTSWHSNRETVWATIGALAWIVCRGIGDEVPSNISSIRATAWHIKNLDQTVPDLTSKTYKHRDRQTATSTYYHKHRHTSAISIRHLVWCRSTQIASPVAFTIVCFQACACGDSNCIANKKMLFTNTKMRALLITHSTNEMNWFAYKQKHP